MICLQRVYLFDTVFFSFDASFLSCNLSLFCLQSKYINNVTSALKIITNERKNGKRNLVESRWTAVIHGYIKVAGPHYLSIKIQLAISETSKQTASPMLGVVIKSRWFVLIDNFPWPLHPPIPFFYHSQPSHYPSLQYPSFEITFRFCCI